MKFDIKNFYDFYESVKTQKEFEEFEKERFENHYILNEKPFNRNKTDNQVIKLINKYKMELNIIALLLGNGATTTNQNYQKSDIQIRDELEYINICIPLIALIRTEISYEFNQIVKQIVKENKNTGR